MGIEYRYDYIYYTVVDINQYLTEDEFTWQVAIDIINRKFEDSEDEHVRKFRVDGARFVSDIDQWIRAQERHKVRPVFTQFSSDQNIVRTGEGQLFELYEEEDDDEDESYYVHSDNNDHGSVDGLAGLGGRL